MRSVRTREEGSGPPIEFTALKHGTKSRVRDVSSPRYWNEKQNLEIFDVELTQDDIEKIDSCARVDGRLADQDPAMTKSSNQRT